MPKKRQQYRHPTTGRFIDIYQFSKLIKAKLASMKYADGRKIKGSKLNFILRAKRERNIKRVNARLKGKYEIEKRERKVSGKIGKKEIKYKILEPEKEPEVIIVGEKGELKTEEIPYIIESYVRYGYRGKKDGDSMYIQSNGAVVMSGKIPMLELLHMTNPSSFYRGWIDLGFRNEIESGEVELMEGSGINYHQQKRYKNNSVFVIPNTEINIEGLQMLEIDKK